MERSEALWSTLERETDAGAVESRQWIMVPREPADADGRARGWASGSSSPWSRRRSTRQSDWRSRA